MSKIAISELFYELATTEQKTYGGGKTPGVKTIYPGFFRYGTFTGKPDIQMPSTQPRYMGKDWGDRPIRRADLYGW
ncbi:MAG: hypothetical protein ACFB14_06090 [Leptolyngbyaceae cyanobacterium]